MVKQYSFHNFHVVFHSPQVLAWPSANLGSYSSVDATGNYTQLVWGATTRVGCGFMYHYDSRSEYATKPYREVMNGDTSTGHASMNGSVTVFALYFFLYAQERLNCHS